MTRSLLIALAAALAAGAIVALAYGPRAGLETTLLLAAVGAAALALAHLAAARRRRQPLSRQFALGVGLTVGCILAATVAGALLMFVSDHDAVMISVITVFAGVLAGRAAQLLAAGVLGDVEEIRDGLVAVGDGRRDVHVPVRGRDELSELASEADAMVTRLASEEARRAAAETARRDLVAGASHDLRTPISALRLLLDAIDDDLVDEPTRRRYQRTMHTHLHALSGLIDDLFELSRIEAGEMTWSMREVAIRELVDDAVAAMAVSAQAKGVELTADLRDPRLAAHADPERVQRVLFNLVHNAIRHTPSDGSVTVRAEPCTQGVEIEVADTGDGIGRDDRARVFEPFYRAGTDAPRRSDGAGLGLAISRAIVEAHGGRIWLEAAPVGTRVRFTLPARAGRHEPAPSASRRSSASAPGPVHSR